MRKVSLGRWLFGFLLLLLTSLVPFGIGGLFALHGFTSFNLWSTDRQALYEVVRGGQRTGIILSGQYLYSSGKALAAFISVPLVGAGLWWLSMAFVDEERTWKLLGLSVLLSLAAFPVYAILGVNFLYEVMGVQWVLSPFVAAACPVLAGTAVFLYGRRNPPF